MATCKAGDFLISIQREHPWLRGERERGVLGVAVALPGQGVYTRAEFFCDGFAFVGGVVERNDDLGDPALHTGKAA